MLKMLLSEMNDPDDMKIRFLWAVENQEYKECQYFLDTRGIDVNSRSAQSMTALMLAGNQGHLNICQLLVEHGAEVDAVDKDGWTAMMWAGIRHETIHIVKYLIEQGASVNHRNNRGRTCLSSAAASYNIDRELLELLLAHGADINTRDVFGCTVMMGAANCEYLFGSGKITERLAMLLEYGADINLRDNKGNTALHYATKRGFDKIVDFIIENGGDINAQNYRGETALIVSMRQEMKNRHRYVDKSKDDHLTKHLIAAGADVDLADHQGKTALIHSLQLEKYEVAKKLIEAGADVNVVDDEDHSTYIYAAMKHNFELCSLLLLLRDKSVQLSQKSWKKLICLASEPMETNE